MLTGKDWQSLCNKIGYRFRNFSLLQEAFVHPSYLANNNEIKSYQRLEFLGDRVINLLVADLIVFRCQDMNEGKMTQYHSMLINTKALATMARQYGLGSYIYMSKGAETEGLRNDNHILACVFEALIGAIFVDGKGDYSAVKKILWNNFFSQLSAVLGRSAQYFDPKSFLQDIAQKKFGTTPRYNLLSSIITLNETHFSIGVTVHGVQIAEGEGKSKKEAEVEAALKALENTKNLTANLPYGLLKHRIVNDDIEFKDVNSAIRRLGTRLAR